MRNYQSIDLSNADKITVGNRDNETWVRITGHGGSVVFYLNEYQARQLLDGLVVYTA